MLQTAVKRFTEEEARAVHARLAECSLPELDRRFRAGAVPDFADIEGRTAGAWLARSPANYWWANWFTRVFLDSPWARWTGKGFFASHEETGTGRGANLFDNTFRPVRYPLDTFVQPAQMDGQPCLVLRYPFGSLMYGVIDNLRVIEDGVFLGQILYRFPWGRRRRFIGYFVLCALAS